MKSILRYSPIKQKAKENPPNSVLNPETNSDSPSEKSKGVRLVSAKIVGNHNISKGKMLNKQIITNFIFKKFRHTKKNLKDRRQKAKLTS